MCDKCTSVGMDLHGLIAHGETVLADIQAPPYWRSLSDIEATYGDVDRVRGDIEASELDLARTAAPVVKEMASQLAAEAAEIAATGDLAGLATLTASYQAKLATVLKEAMARAITRGRQQIRDQRDGQTGTKLAEEPPAKDPLRAAQYLDAKAKVDAGKIGHAIVTVVQDATLSAVGRGAATTETESALTAAILAGERALVAIARSGGREANGIGRLYGFDEVRSEVASVHYTAILDSAVCEVCQPMDGKEYGPEGFGKAPNPDCLGARYGNSCRCFEIIIFRKTF